MDGSNYQTEGDLRHKERWETSDQYLIFKNEQIQKIITIMAVLYFFINL